jgi:hypothetical protein
VTGGDYASWGYNGNPFGDDECGKFYARAMSVWSLLLATQGFVYDGPAGIIGFKPAWKPEDHASFFTAAEGYGVFAQKRKGDAQTDRIEVKSGKLEVTSLVFELPVDANPSKIVVMLDGKEIQSSGSLDEGSLTVSFTSRLTVNVGQTLEVVAK